MLAVAMFASPVSQSGSSCDHIIYVAMYVNNMHTYICNDYAYVATYTADYYI